MQPNQSLSSTSLLKPYTRDAIMNTPLTGFKVQIPDTIPSQTFDSNVSSGDVFQQRSMFEQKQNQNAFIGQSLNSLSDGVFNFVDNPSGWMQNYMDQGPSSLEQMQQSLLGDRTKTIQDFYAGRADQISDAQNQFNVPGLQGQLAETSAQIAEREARKRKDLRNFDTNAENRGYAREFVTGAKNKMEADANAELADMAIIQAAQTGNLELAIQQANDLTSQQLESAIQELDLYQAQLDELKPMLDSEQKLESDMLQAAIDARKSEIDDYRSQRDTIHEMMIEVAANGGSPELAMQISQSGSVEEAISLAVPYIGLVDRQNTISLMNQRLDQSTQTATNPQLAQMISSGEIDVTDPEVIRSLPVDDLTKSVMAGMIKTKDLTPTQKAEVVAQMYQVGFNPNQYIFNKLQNLVGLWGSIPDGSKGFVEGRKFWESSTVQQVSSFESAKTVLNREVARLNDVGMLSDQDVADYMNAMPARTDKNLGVVINKINGLSATILGKMEARAGQQTNDGNYIGPDGRTVYSPDGKVVGYID